jgi:hypothetical protein
MTHPSLKVMILEYTYTFLDVSAGSCMLSPDFQLERNYGPCYDVWRSA